MTPPEPGVAQAYLNEAARVASRREQHIDRRRADWCIDGESGVPYLDVAVPAVGAGMTSRRALSPGERWATVVIGAVLALILLVTSAFLDGRDG